MPRTPDYAQFLVRLAAWQAQGRPVALADVAYPNGSDPLLTELLLSDGLPAAGRRPVRLRRVEHGGQHAGDRRRPGRLRPAHRRRSPAPPRQTRFLAHRFLEDYGYQTVVRREARADAEARWGRRDPDPDSPEEVARTSAASSRAAG